MSTEQTNVTEEAKKRGRMAMTQEQKDARQKIYNLFHGEGKHTMTVGIKVNPEERSMLRSFAKKVSTEEYALGIDDVFAGTLRYLFFGVPFNTVNTLDFLQTAIAEQSNKVNSLAREYERENETGELGKLRKQAEGFAEMKASFIRAGMEVPQSISDAIDAAYALIDALTLERNSETITDDESTEETSGEVLDDGIDETNDGRI